MPAPAFLSRLQRVTSSGKFISEIDGLRFISIATVLLFHINQHPFFYQLGHRVSAGERVVVQTLLGQGFHGVELFFVISGFILSLPFASHFLNGKPNVRLGEYYLRRLTRLEPPYILCLIVLFALAVVVKGADSGALFPHLLASLGYLHNVMYGHESLVNGVAWSLEIEIQFYLLVPVLTMIFAVRNTLIRRSIIVGVGALAMAFQWFVVGSYPVLSLTLLNYLQCFMIGFLLADVFLVEWRGQPVRSARWDIVSLLGWPLLLVNCNLPEESRSVLAIPQGAFLHALLFPPLTFALYCAAFRGKYTNRFVTSPWIVTVGGMCYTIYLFHNFIIGGAMRITTRLLPEGSYAVTFLLHSVVIIPAILAFCTMYYLLIERPCMDKRWPQKFASKLALFAVPRHAPQAAVLRQPVVPGTSVSRRRRMSSRFFPRKGPLL